MIGAMKGGVKRMIEGSCIVNCEIVDQCYHYLYLNRWHESKGV